jgi:ribosomal protein S18 acetylase RimI-like enzyme
VIVRRATVQDAAGIADVQVRTWLVAYADIVDRAKLEARAVGREQRWRETLAGGTPTWVAEEDRRIVGIMSAAPSRDEDAPPGTGEVWMIYVAPEAQRRGIGAALMDEALDRLRALGCETATLWVFEANSAARGFYERMGFAHDGGPPNDDQWAPELRYRRAL